MSLVGSTLAQTSLYIPGFDPQPLSADILGTDAQGRTTWAIHAGTPTGTFIGADDVFPGTATLVEGPNDAFFTYADVVSIGARCSLSGNVAACSATESGSLVTETETFTRIEVQAGTTASLTAATGSPTPSGNTFISVSTPTNSQSSHASHTQTTSTAIPTSNDALGICLGPLFVIVPAVAVFMQL